MGRKVHSGNLKRKSYERARKRFIDDWVLSYNILDLDVGTLSGVESLVERFPIRGPDAVQLSAALWLRDMCSLAPSFAEGDQTLEFGSTDDELVGYARESGLNIFNPLD